MPNIQLAPFFIDDLTLAVIDRLRDRVSREEFFRRMIEYGLCTTLEELARLRRDYAAQDTSHKTALFQKGRDLLNVEAARNPAQPAPEDKD